MNTASIRFSSGFTLIELIVAIAVAAILITIAVPSFQEILKRNQIASQNNELIALIHLARNEAIRRNPTGNDTVRVDLASDGDAWEGYVSPPGDVDTVQGCPVGAIRCTDHTRVFLSRQNGNDMVVRFDNRGYSVDGSGNLDQVDLLLEHRDCTSDRHAKSVTVLRTGQVISEAVPCFDG